MGQDGPGGNGAFLVEKKFELSGGRPQLMRNCTSSALEKPVSRYFILFNFSVLCRCSCLYAEVLPIVVSVAQPCSLCALSRSYRERNADESNCEMPLQGGRGTLHKPFFSGCFPLVSP